MVSVVNRRLRQLYKQAATDFFRNSRLQSQYVGPFLTSCPDGYSELRIPWMYVGQETCGWQRMRAASEVPDLMSTHTGFCSSNPRAGTPFWSFAYALDRRINPGGPTRSFIWSNLSRIGKADSAGRVPNSVLEFWTKRRLLASEVTIFKPKFLLLVTGPAYDDLLTEEFPGISLSPLSPHSPVSEIRHTDLPELSFRAYHPAYLRRRDSERKVVEFLARKISRQESLHGKA